MERDPSERTHCQGNRTNGCRLGFLIHILGCIQPVGEIQPVYLCQTTVDYATTDRPLQAAMLGTSPAIYHVTDSHHYGDRQSHYPA